MHVCLRAERASGCLEFVHQELARAVGKSRSTLGRCLRELAGKGVCELQATPNQHRVSRLRVRPEYWPYEVREEPARKQGRAERAGPRTAGEATAYVTEVRRLFCQPACVQGRCGAVDEPVRSLRYFAGLLVEVRTESFPASYWRHLGFNLRRCERLWRNRPVDGAESARPDLA